MYTNAGLQARADLCDHLVEQALQIDYPSRETSLVIELKTALADDGRRVESLITSKCMIYNMINIPGTYVHRARAAGDLGLLEAFRRTGFYFTVHDEVGVGTGIAVQRCHGYPNA